ncbi:MAG: hypothetical protein IH908_14640 [Proteobacteria bacterium]|nr:hypothetical protein [Pseudomonadota bacterium]
MWIMVMGGTLFLATHLGVSSTTLRPMLTDKLGQRGYLGLYSLLAVVTLGHLIWLYNIVPRYDYFWELDPRLTSADMATTAGIDLTAELLSRLRGIAAGPCR